MESVLGIIRYKFESANKINIVWCLLILLTMLVLAILHHRWKYYEKEMKQWRKMCFIPLLITFVHYLIYVSGAPFLLSDYTPMYLIAVLALLPMICSFSKKGYRVTAVVSGAISVCFGLHFCTAWTNVHNFSRQSYSKSFHSLSKEMGKSYVLTEWKDIDIAELEKKYMPMVKEAEKAEDPAKFAEAVTMFCNEFHDGHISVHADFDFEKYPSSFVLRDYGLSMVKLDSGEVIAVCTSEEINKLGISDGTVITEWDGKPVLQTVKEMAADNEQAVLANAERDALFELAGTGGENVDVSFLDSSGKEQTVTLSALEEEGTYDEAIDAFLHHTEHRRDLMMSNYSTKMLDDKCGYLMLAAESTGGQFRDELAAYTGKCSWARKVFRKKLRSLREQGMEYLIIDMRNNMGGTGEIGYELCGLLSSEERYAAGFGVRKNGEYVRICEHHIQGNGEFADIKAVVLTNYNCISAGDSTAFCLSKLPNVTLAGITDPNGSAQMSGGGCVLSDGVVGVLFPVYLTINEAGEPDIDPKADRISRDPCEVRIPLDYDAAMKIFRDKEDYELEWAVKYLEDNE